MRKYLVVFILLLTGARGFANMASPTTEGTRVSNAFSSKDINILKEEIIINIDSGFIASYTIVYHIETKQEGRQVHLLFYALDYRSDFTVQLDDTPVTVKEIPEEYNQVANTPFIGFDEAFFGKPEHTLIYWEENAGQYCSLNELKYFEADLSGGQHTVKVSYKASAWEKISGWITEYSQHYALSPARYWQSFGELDITLQVPVKGMSLKTNLGKPIEGSLDSVARWHFAHELPVECIIITCKPKVSTAANIMIAIGPGGFMCLIALLLAILHFYLIRAFRSSNLQRKYSPVVIVGSLVIPFLILFSFMPAYDLIDMTIGPQAARRHGYTFLILIFYPVLVPLYFVVFWLADRSIKRRLSVRNRSVY